MVDGESEGSGQYWPHHLLVICEAVVDTMLLGIHAPSSCRETLLVLFQATTTPDNWAKALIIIQACKLQYTPIKYSCFWFAEWLFYMD
jgi:hypothetical protein